MFLNYFKIAIRNLRKGKIYSAINLLGLTIGTTVCILIMLFVIDEYSYDQFHEKSDEIYRAWVKEHYQGDIFFNSVTPFILGPVLRDNIPEIKEVVQYLTINSRARRAAFSDDETIHVVEPGFLNLFDFPILNGDKKTALSELHQVVLTPSAAKKYFGDEAPLGEIVSLQVAGEWTDFTVAAIVADPPSNSSIQFDFLIPYKNCESFTSERGRASWTIVFPETYVLTDVGTDLAQLDRKIATLIDEQVAKIYKPGEYVVGLQPLSDIHLNPEVPLGLVPVSDRKYPQILSGIGLLILLLACINFTSLAIGRSVTRAKEVAIRKVTGATRKQLMFQFWTEAVLTAMTAMVIGLALAAVAMPYFNLLTAKNLGLAMTINSLSIFAILAIVTGIVAGGYPALVLSGFSPLRALKGTLSNHGKATKHQILRWLIGFQYALSIVLITSTLVMQSQIKFLQNKNLGFNKEQIIVLPYQVSGQGLTDMWTDMSHIEGRVANACAHRQDIKAIATSTHTIGTPGWAKVGFTDQESDRFRNFTAQQISANYLDMMDIKLLEGRNFLSERESDQKAAIVNQAMVDAYQLIDPIGKTLPGPFREYQIIGITADYQYASLHNPVAPLVMVKDAIPLFQAAPDMTGNDGLNPKLSFKVQSDDASATLAFLEKTWSEVAPEQAFNFSFLDDNLDRQYSAESRLSHIVSLATLLAIFIACLGLFGIGILTIMQRRREIGVRKVLGASTLGIVLLINKRFSMMVLIAAIVAIPVAWYMMSDWLASYAYQIKLSPLVFLLAALIALLLSWISVGAQSVAAALSNPVKSIRDE